MNPLLEAREITALTDGNQFHKFLRNTGFYLTARNPSIILFVIHKVIFVTLMEYLTNLMSTRFDPRTNYSTTDFILS